MLLGQQSVNAAPIATRLRRSPPVADSPSWSVRTLLIWLVCACLFPGLVGATLLIVREYRDGRARLETETLRLVRTLVQNVDTRLQRAQAMAEALARSNLLAQGDWAAFHRYARQTLNQAELGSHLVLCDGRGRLIFDTEHEYGTAPPPNADLQCLAAANARDRPVISSLHLDPTQTRHLIGIDAPVVRNGRTTHVLRLNLLPKDFDAILRAENLRTSWVTGILDGTGTMVARTHSADQLIGMKAGSDLLEAINAAPEGSLDRTTREGLSVYSIYRRSPTTYWTVSIGIPREVLEAELKHKLSLLAYLILNLFALGLGLAWMIGGKIARSVRALTSPAVALGAGEAVAMPAVDIREAEEVAHALREAAELLQARTLALQAAKAEAERADNAKSRFLAAASHDLRQPLTALSLYVGALKSHVAPPGHPILAHLKDCIGSLSGLLTDLLDFSKLQAGVVTPHTSDFALDETLASLIAIHRPEAQLKGLRLRSMSAGLSVRSDPVLFKRILGNLIDNAIRYTERGGILIGCRRRGGRRWVEVWDTGIGIPKEKTREIFDEFKQLGDQARTRGSGLGLAIAAKTAALLNLQVSVRSRPGRGSVFALELPLGHTQTNAENGSPPALAHSLRIALVEDNEMVRQALDVALQGKGHRVIAASSGQLLLAALAGQSPDVIVSDYRLAHGETGFDVITRVRQACSQATSEEIPAILITGDTDPDLMRSMADRGVIILHKPLNLDALQAYLDDLVARPSQSSRETAQPVGVAAG